MLKTLLLTTAALALSLSLAVPAMADPTVIRLVSKDLLSDRKSVV